MHPVKLVMPLYYVLYAIYEVTGHLSEGSFVRNVVVQILKFDAKPNPNPNPNPNPSPNPNSMPIRFGKMTLRTSELLPIYDAVLSFCWRR